MDITDRKILRGDVFFANLDPIVGSEQGGSRPVLVLQNNTGNHFSPTVIVAAITSKPKPHLPTHMPISCIPELGDGSVALLEQLRTIDKRRLQRHIGTIGHAAMRVIDDALAVSLAMHRCKADEPIVMTLCCTCKMSFEDSGYVARLLSNLNDAKETCDFCNHRKGFDYELERM
jgi:mRNA interferase MazF